MKYFIVLQKCKDHILIECYCKLTSKTEMALSGTKVIKVKTSKQQKISTCKCLFVYFTGKR